MPIAELILRPATTADCEFAFQVWKAAMEPYIEATWGWNENSQRQRQQQEFAVSPHQIIEFADRPIGTLIVKYPSDYIYLSGLYFLPAYQRQGFGSRILEGLLAQGQAHHLPVCLRVLKVNPQAQHLYQRMGFAVTDEEEKFVVMEKLP
jgi:ribosomal protein S18 acetylase RimI-like enzyme